MEAFALGAADEDDLSSEDLGAVGYSIHSGLAAWITSWLPVIQWQSEIVKNMAGSKTNCCPAETAFSSRPIPLRAILLTIWNPERVYETALEVLAPFRRTAELLIPDRGRRFHS